MECVCALCALALLALKLRELLLYIRDIQAHATIVSIFPLWTSFLLPGAPNAPKRVMGKNVAF